MSTTRDRSSSPNKAVVLKKFPKQLVNSPYLPSNDIGDLVKFSKYIKNDNKVRLMKSKSASLAGNSNRSNIEDRRTCFSGHERETKQSLSSKVWKKAALLADKALQTGKVFTCDAPYPVDVFVRMSLRKRGWVEKFAVKFNRTPSNYAKISHTECDSLNLSSEVVQLICSEKYPNILEENDGLYYIASGHLQHHGATFIWGNKSVNNMVFRDNVIVNHFPKSKYFSSKFLLATCLKELKWHIDSHPNFFFPRCYLLNEADKDEFIEDFELTACMGLLKQILLMNECKDSQIKSVESDISCEKIHPNSTNFSESMHFKVLSSSFMDDHSSDNCDNGSLFNNYNKQNKVLPDLLATMRIKKGGIISKQCFEWAMTHCENFLVFKTHKDLDSRKTKCLRPQQMEQLMEWCLQVSRDGAIVENLSDSRMEDCKKLLSELKKVWDQFEIDGSKNLWILKPGHLSKGIGIFMTNDLKEICLHLSKQSTQDYVVQKYIVEPVDNSSKAPQQRKIILKYLHLLRSVHLSNIAVQENYLNGERSEKIPQNNFLTSDGFRKYLHEIGHDEKWEDKIYPGMKLAVINCLISTQEFFNNRKNGFELYGADFMLSEDFSPWLLEINSSPGMSPTCPEKVQLCASVIEDTLRVVLDDHEDSKENIGNYELIHQSYINPNTKGTSNKFLLEGLRIKRNYLLKFSKIDKNAVVNE